MAVVPADCTQSNVTICILGPFLGNPCWFCRAKRPPVRSLLLFVEWALMSRSSCGASLDGGGESLPSQHSSPLRLFRRTTIILGKIMRPMALTGKVNVRRAKPRYFIVGSTSLSMAMVGPPTIRTWNWTRIKPKTHFESE